MGFVVVETRSSSDSSVEFICTFSNFLCEVNIPFYCNKNDITLTNSDIQEYKINFPIDACNNKLK